uniref:Uncharacterized protein n=1 Tax=Timema cristinae TaxID=61476 RepID=A0A7R9CV44_TIMCR|nr:unnamed protein product [Timema cristinae]
MKTKAIGVSCMSNGFEILGAQQKPRARNSIQIIEANHQSETNMFLLNSPTVKSYRPMTSHVQLNQSEPSVRRCCEGLVIYETIVDCLMFPGIIGNSDAILKRIFNMATRLKAYKSRDFILSLGREVKNNFKRSMCELSFIRTVARFPEMFSFIRMPVKVERAIPENGVFPDDWHQFGGLITRVETGIDHDPETVS